MSKLLVIVALVGIVTFSLGDAHASAGLRAIGVGAGYASPENIDGTWMAGVHLDFGLPVMNLYVQPFVGYWSKSIEASAGTLGSAESSISDWMVGGNLKYSFPTSAVKVHPYVKGGIAAHIIGADASGQVLGQSISVSTSDTKIGFQGGAGLVVDAGDRWSVFGEGNYHIVEDFNQWMVGGGVQLNF